MPITSTLQLVVGMREASQGLGTMSDIGIVFAAIAEQMKTGGPALYEQKVRSEK